VIIDTNVSLSRWPFRRLPADEPAKLVSTLRRYGVTEAWAGTFDALLHKDLTDANSRLARDCKRYGNGLLVPFGSVNPKLPGWQEDLRQCHEVHQMPGIRLHPNYHGYALADSVFSEVLEAAAARKLIVQVACCMEDERTQHPLVRVPPVDLSPLPDLLKRLGKVRLALLNSRAAPRSLSKALPDAAQVCCDFAMIEGPGALARFIDQIAPARVVFGSNFPLYYFESALLKVQEAGLSEAGQKAVFEENVRTFRISRDEAHS
jgi:uncharacterized protein